MSRLHDKLVKPISGSLFENQYSISSTLFNAYDENAECYFLYDHSYYTHIAIAWQVLNNSDA